MPLTSPWRFSNYMGEHVSDAAIAAWFSAVSLSASNGMVYYNTTTHRLRFYRNGAWRGRHDPLSAVFLGATPYADTNSTTFSTIGYLHYEGTGEWTPTVFRAVCSRSGTTDNAEIRVIDYATANVIATINYTADTIAARSTTSLANLPSSSSVLAIQHRKTGGSRTRTHSVELD